MNEKKNSKTLLIAFVCIVFLGAGAWGITKAFSRPKPDENRQLLAKSKEDPGKMMDEFRDKMRDKNLTDAEREKLRESMRNVWDSRVDEAVGEYYAAKPDDREAILNKHIDEMEKWRKMREEREREEQEKAKAEGKSEEEREKERQKEREQWRKSMSDRSKEQRKSDSETRNPNKMAQRMAYMSALHKQMDARGIKPTWGGGGGGGRGFGRG